MASGAVSATGSPEVMSQTPNSTPTPATRANGPPMRPIITSGRGSSLDRHKNPVPEPGAELRAEKGGLVMDGEQSTGDVNSRPTVVCGIGEMLAQGHDRHQAHHADQNEDRLHRARGDVAEGNAFTDPLHDGDDHPAIPRVPSPRAQIRT
jgi:hypothetical protein